MGTVASQITSLTIVYTTVYSDADQSKHQSSASLAFVWGIHRRPVNSPHKWPVTRKMFPFDDVIMIRDLLCFVVVWLVFNLTISFRVTQQAPCYSHAYPPHCQWSSPEEYGQMGEMNPLRTMMTSSNGNIFRVTGPLCGKSPVTGEKQL